MKKLTSIFILLMTISSFAQFKLPKKADWEIANTKPIVVMQLDEDDENAATFNPNIKKYVEEIFGAERVHEYLKEKDFKKFIKKNKEKYNYIGFNYVHKKAIDNPFAFTSIFFGICGKAFMMGDGSLITYHYQYDKENSSFFKTKFQVITESDIKFAIGTFKKSIVNGLEQEDLSMKEMIKKSKETSLKSMNPNSNELKDLTLLIDKDVLSEEHINQFKTEYNYKYEIVSHERIEQAILNNEKGFAFTYEHFKPLAKKDNIGALTIRYAARLFYIYSAEDYKQMFFYVPKTSSMGFRAGGVKKEDMVSMDEYVEKLNSVIE